jgi:hypothetical protein
MKPFSLLFFCIVLIAGTVSAQAYEGNIQYDKKKQQAIVIDYTYPPEAVNNAVLLKLEKMGYKAKEEKGLLNRDKGFLVYKNIYITEISQDRMDYLVKVERKSRKANDESVLYMIIMKDNQNALTTMQAYDIGNAKLFLNNLLPEIEEANLELQIKAQEDVVAKAEKKLSGLQKDKKELEEKLANNAKSQDETIKDIEAQKQNLEILKGKRRNY